MSLLNAWITPTEATVAVDTDGVAQDGTRYPTSKLMIIPHLNVVMGLRGQAAFLALLFMRSISASFDTFDQLNDAMLEFVAEVEGYMPDELVAKVGRLGNELVLVGWSARRSKMLGRLFVKRDDMAEWFHTDIDFHLSPYHKSMQDLPRKQQALQRIAAMQVHFMRATFPNAACGGKLMVCHLTQNSVSVSHRANFETREAAA